MLMKIIKWGLLALLVFFVVTQPAEAAHAFHSGLNLLITMANGFSSFVANLA